LFEPAKALEEAAKAGDGGGARAALGLIRQLEQRIRSGHADAAQAPQEPVPA
jgi:hypothetical protein